MKRKKVIFFANTLKIGGMEKALVNLLNELYLFDKYDITLVLESKEGFLINTLNKNIIIKEYKLASDKNIFVRKSKNFFKRVIWVIKNYHCYAFSCSYATYSIIGSKLAQIASKNNSLYVHSDYYELYERNVEQVISFFKQLDIEKIKNVIFVSNESMEKICTVFPRLINKFCVINNLVDYTKILDLSNQRIDYNFSNNTNFIFIGRLEEESKQICLLINSFSKAYLKNPKIKLLIIGDGKDRKLYENLIKKNRMETNIEMLGEIVNPYPYLKKADCLILTSKYEGFPIVYNESLVLGKPILTTVNVSDDFYNISDYADIILNNEKSIIEKIVNFKKNKVNYDIDFEFVNKMRLKKMHDIIEK